MATQPTSLKDAGLLTPAEAANRLDVSIPTLRKLVGQGKIAPPIRRNSRWVRYRECDISAYITGLLRSNPSA